MKTISFLRYACHNPIWYQSLVKLFKYPSDTSIDAPEAVGFHIIPQIIVFLPLDFVQKSLSKCVAPRECAHCGSRG